MWCLKTCYANIQAGYSSEWRDLCQNQRSCLNVYIRCLLPMAPWKMPRMIHSCCSMKLSGRSQGQYWKISVVASTQILMVSHSTIPRVGTGTVSCNIGASKEQTALKVDRGVQQNIIWWFGAFNAGLSVSNPMAGWNLKSHWHSIHRFIWYLDKKPYFKADGFDICSLQKLAGGIVLPWPTQPMFFS